jgi:hypothetical protein
VAESRRLVVEAAPALLGPRVHENPAESREDVPGEARHKDQVHPYIPTEEPAQQRRHYIEGLGQNYSNKDDNRKDEVAFIITERKSNMK